MNGELHGTDLDLGFVADEQGRTFASPMPPADLQARVRPDVAPRASDLGVISGRANLVQALIVRLKTRQGELDALGHPGYGSRHHELIGEPNTETNRNLVKLHVLSCLRQEPRLEEMLAVAVRPVAGPAGRSLVQIEVEAIARGESTPLNLVIPFSFTGPLE